MSGTKTIVPNMPKPERKTDDHRNAEGGVLEEVEGHDRMIAPNLKDKEQGQDDGGEAEESKDFRGRPSMIARDRECNHQRHQTGDQGGGALEVDIAQGSR